MMIDRTFLFTANEQRLFAFRKCKLGCFTSKIRFFEERLSLRPVFQQYFGAIHSSAHLRGPTSCLPTHRHQLGQHRGRLLYVA